MPERECKERAKRLHPRSAPVGSLDGMIVHHEYDRR